MSKHPFELFINLVTFDQETNKITFSLQTEQKLLEELQSNIRKLNQELEEKKNIILSLRKKVDNTELEMKTLDTQEAEKKRRLDTISDHKEYTSLKTEIERLQRAQVEQEQQVVSAWNKLETAQKELEELQNKTETEINQLKTEIELKTTTISQLQETFKDRQVEREKEVAQVPAEWLSKYEIMQSRVSDPVVPVENRSCSSCFTMLTDTDLQRIQKGALLQCKMCYRLLYSPEVMHNGK